MEHDEYESVLFIANDCHVYQIPPRTSTEGYRAANWGDMGQPLWRGRIRVIERGSGVPSKCFIRLEDNTSGELFALCPYQPSRSNTNGGVEAVLDSSRYFVLTVVDQESGQKAYLGMGFPERTESFDFNVALQDWSKRQTPTPISSSGTLSSASRSGSGPAASPHVPVDGPKDFSLKPGETLNIKIGGTSTRKKAPTTGMASGAGGLGGLGNGGFLLPPPPPPAPRGR